MTPEIPSGILTEPAEYLAFWREAITLLLHAGYTIAALLMFIAVLLVIGLLTDNKRSN